MTALKRIVICTLLIPLAATSWHRFSHSAPLPRITSYTIRDADGDARVLRFTQRIGAHGIREVSISLLEERRFLPDTYRQVLTGKDLDGDQLYDAWFYADEGGVIEGVDRPSTRPDGSDAAIPILTENLDLDNRWYAAMLFDGITMGLTFTRSHERDVMRQLKVDEENLRELEIRTQRIQRQDPRNPHLTRLYSTISDGWLAIADELSGPAIRDHILAATADVASYALGVALIRGLGQSVKWAGAKLVTFGNTAFASKFYTRYVRTVLQKADGASRLVRERMGRLTPNSAPRFLAPLVLRASQRVSVTLQALDARGKLGHAVAQGLKRSLEMGSAGVSQWKYITLTQSIQLMVEVVNRRDTVFDPNPIILGKNIVSDKDLVQNVGYMTTETFLLAGITTAMMRRGQPIMTRMVVCGIVSMINSASMNFLIKGNVDAGRAALDTGWEVAVGNMQTQVDMAALGLFEQLSRRTGDPGLKLVGYAVTMFDQTLGYTGYNAATMKYESYVREKDKPDLKLMPIYAPVASVAAGFATQARPAAPIMP